MTEIEVPTIRESLKSLWNIDDQVVYLNHGSFGPPPQLVATSQRAWLERCQRQPMNFFLRELRPAWLDARALLADFVGTDASNLIFCENATFGMNHLASFFPLAAGDEVVLCDHEYGVVQGIWRRRCEERQAVYRELRIALPIDSRDAVVDAFLAALTERTKLLVISHITSPTAITLPVHEIIRVAKKRGIAVCVDGPHVPLQIPLTIDALQCDFYIASCHKWLSAPFGSGFLYVHPNWQREANRPLALSWGRLPPDPIEHWTDAYQWQGTRDYSPYLCIADAIRFFNSLNLEAARSRNHELCRYARRTLQSTLRQDALVPDHHDWFAMMTAVWLPPGDHSTLQHRLWARHRVEVPIVSFNQRFHVRVSCHLYNSTDDIDHLSAALRAEIKGL